MPRGIVVREHQNERGRPFAPNKVAYLLFGVVPAIPWATLMLLAVGMAMDGVADGVSNESLLALAGTLALLVFAWAGVVGLWQAASRDPAECWYGRTTLLLTLGVIAAAVPAGLTLYVLLFEPPSIDEPGLWLTASIFGPLLLAGVFLFRQLVYAGVAQLRALATCID